MTDKLKQTIKEEIGKLPKENQGVINNFGWEKISEEIGKKYLLSENEINDFQIETLLVLVRVEDINDYAKNIEDNVGTSKKEAEKIADEAFKKIFTPIGSELEENIKKSGIVENSTVEQSLNFILSGGDYSVFVVPNSPLEEYPSGGGGISTPPSKLATPQEGNETPETVLPVFFINEK